MTALGSRQAVSHTVLVLSRSETGATGVLEWLLCLLVRVYGSPGLWQDRCWLFGLVLLCPAIYRTKPVQVLERAAAAAAADGAGAAKPARFDGRAFRRSLNDTGRYTRKPSNDPSSLALMEEHGVGYSSTGLVAQMRENGNRWQQGEVLVELAEAYGFCWGVERAVQMAYEARRAYPQQRLHITNEIIHNPGGCPGVAAWHSRVAEWGRLP